MPGLLRLLHFTLLMQALGALAGIVVELTPFFSEPAVGIIAAICMLWNILALFIVLLYLLLGHTEGKRGRRMVRWGLGLVIGAFLVNGLGVLILFAANAATSPLAVQIFVVSSLVLQMIIGGILTWFVSAISEKRRQQTPAQAEQRPTRKIETVKTTKTQERPSGQVTTEVVRKREQRGDLTTRVIRESTRRENRPQSTDSGRGSRRG